MSSNNTKHPLFACSRCFTRHPFEELSSGQQLCKECRGTFPVVKCTYCRSEFQQTMKGSTSTICKKCEQNVKSYGRPSACEYCNTIAAFIGNKCQRCTNSEKRYGLPVTCEQCKQKCAFDRHDEDKKVDGKLLCWLCTLSYKRALARTKQTESDRKAHLKMMQQQAAKNKEQKVKSHNKRPHRVDVTKLPPQSDSTDSNGPTPVKTARVSAVHDPHDVNSDNVAQVTQLREKIANLQKQISVKDGQLLAKERQITELKAKNFTSESEMRNKMKSNEKEFDNKISTMQHKISTLLKEVATLSKSTKRDRKSAGNSEKIDNSASKIEIKNEIKNEVKSESGSGTDSPVP